MKKLNLITLVLAALILVTIWGCGEKIDNDTVLVVDDEVTTLDDFRSLAAQRFAQTPGQPGEEQLEEYLNVILEEQLKAIDGRNKGYANRPEVQTAYEEARNMAAIGALYNEVIVDSLLPEDTLRAYYDRDGFEVNASHILIRIDQDTDSVQAYEDVVRIRDIILEDGDIDSAAFSEAAKQYSEDQSAQDGELGFFRRGTMVPSFENAAFSAEPDKVTEPVYTPFGWHLLYVHEIRPVEDRPTFEEDKQRIQQLVMREYGEQLLDAARTFVESLEQERDVEYQEENIEAAHSAMAGKTSRDPFSLLTEQQLELPLATYDEGQVTAGDMRQYARRMMSGRQIPDAETMKALVQNYITEKVLLPNEAKKHGFFSREEVLDQAKYAADMRIRQIVNQDLNQLDEPTDEELRAYFEEHAEDYMVDAQYTAVEVFVENRELADSIKALAEEGTSLRELAAEFSVRPGAKEKQGVLGPFRKAEYGAIGRNAPDAEIGELMGPLRSQGKWTVFKVISKEEPRTDEFENVQKKVRVDWREWARENRKETYIDSLKQAINYQINTEALSRVFEDKEQSGDQS